MYRVVNPHSHLLTRVNPHKACTTYRTDTHSVRFLQGT